MSSSATDVAYLVRRAYDRARAGDLQGAAGVCAEVLQVDSSQPQAWLLRAVIAMRTGNPGEAVAAAQRALPTHPAQATIRALMGDAFHELGQPRDALENYRAALRMDPGLGSALFGQGRALIALQRQREAVVSFDELLKRQPDDFEALTNRGRALFDLKDTAGALESYDRAAAIRPSDADVKCNRGAVLLLMQRCAEALKSFDEALSLAPEHPEAHSQRGLALGLLGESLAAAEAFKAALRARPDFTDALVGLGETLRGLRRPVEALQCFERALSLSAASVPAQRGVGDALLDLSRPAEALAAHEAALRLGAEREYSLLSQGNSLSVLGRHAEAIAAYEESLRLNPDNASAWCERARVLLRQDNRADEAIDSYARALSINPDLPFVPGQLLHVQTEHADWSMRVPCASRDAVLDGVRAGKQVCEPFAFLSVSDDPSAQLQCARGYTRSQLPADLVRAALPRYGHKRVRLAYVSADLREHALSYLLAGVFEQHDRERFEVNAIALSPEENSVTGRRVRGAFERFIDVSTMNDRGIVDLMRELEIDIAIDLTGYTRGFRPPVFGAGVAPVQVSYLGYPGTMGASFIDYLIADDFVVPADHRRFYCESIAYLPECFQANDDRRPISERRFTRAEQGLPDGAPVLCCLNTNHKVNPATFGLWMRLLGAAPTAVLWLLGQAQQVQERLRHEAAARGIDPRRLVFAKRLPYPEHLARLRLADLFLDTLPFNAGTTASDALWAGVPVLSCAGAAFAARMAGSLLRNVGLSELVTANLTEFESLALHLLTTPSRLDELRARLAANRRTTPLFDTRRFTRHLEAAYIEMWRRHECGEAAATFTVAPASAKSQ